MAWRAKAAHALGFHEMADVKLYAKEELSVHVSHIVTSIVPRMGLSCMSSFQHANLTDADLEWAHYDPDNDDYDVRTAPIQPLCGSHDLLPKQIGALQRRIRQGGDRHVLEHYRSVIEDMEQSSKDALSCRHSLLLPITQRSSHRRSLSVSSLATEASTCCPSDEDVLLSCIATTSRIRSPAPRTAQVVQQIKQQRLAQFSGATAVRAGC
eukprot:TRINITY_DN37173_c0_g1_i1.p1 TRINITY_DN37173_c0_g1~~TRINITY_DN37173_c0_g1_i1.p1  ORF type:complete len:238 (+),score=21.36 TRINITY_DN37173_c0_g1_i1:86-715(+)